MAGLAGWAAAAAEDSAADERVRLAVRDIRTNSAEWLGDVGGVALCGES